jgi:hypothetical protein
MPLKHVSFVSFTGRIINSNALTDNTSVARLKSSLHARSCQPYRLRGPSCMHSTPAVDALATLEAYTVFLPRSAAPTSIIFSLPIF